MAEKTTMIERILGMCLGIVMLEVLVFLTVVTTRILWETVKYGWSLGGLVQ